MTGNVPVGYESESNDPEEHFDSLSDTSENSHLQDCLVFKQHVRDLSVAQPKLLRVGNISCHVFNRLLKPHTRAQSSTLQSQLVEMSLEFVFLSIAHPTRYSYSPIKSLLLRSRSTRSINSLLHLPRQPILRRIELLPNRPIFIKWSSNLLSDTANISVGVELLSYCAC